MFRGLDENPVMLNKWISTPLSFHKRLVEHVESSMLRSFLSGYSGSAWVRDIHDEDIISSVSKKQPYLPDSRHCVLAVHLDVLNMSWITVPCTKRYPFATVLCASNNPVVLKKTLTLTGSKTTCPEGWITGLRQISEPPDFCWTAVNELAVELFKFPLNESNCINFNGNRHFRIHQNKEIRAMRRYVSRLGNVREIHRTLSWKSSFQYLGGKMAFFSNAPLDVAFKLCKNSDLFENILLHNLFLCHDKTYIIVHRQCDGYRDCLDNSDEENCSPICSSSTCIQGCFQHNCTCGDLYFQCPSGNCIPSSKIEDDHCDCADCYDEELYDQPKDKVWAFPRRTIAPSGSTNDRYYCADNTETFHPDIFCKYDPKLRNGCFDNSHLAFCDNFICRDMFKCRNSFCIPFHTVCDGRIDCPYGEDEVGCATLTCKWLLKCGSDMKCVHPDHICDGVNDCPSGEDEAVCKVKQCPTYCSCLGYAVSCVSQDLNTIPNNIEYVKSLNLSRNRICSTCLHAKKFNQLYILDLSFNSISVFEKGEENQFNTLVILNLEGNEISEIRTDTFLYLYSLKTLILKSNPIQMIYRYAFKPIPLAMHLDLSYQHLHILHEGTFTEMENLEQLILRNNNLKILNGKSFDGMWQLTLLDLRENPLTFLSSDTFKGLPKLHSLLIDNSNWCCLSPQVIRGCHTFKVAPNENCNDFFLTFSTRMSYQVLLGAIILSAILQIFQALVAKCKRSKSSLSTEYKTFSYSNTSHLFVTILTGCVLLVLIGFDVFTKDNAVNYRDIWKKSFMCRVIHPLGLLTGFNSVQIHFNMITMRSMMIYKPFKYRSLLKKRALSAVLLPWLIGTAAISFRVLLSYTLAIAEPFQDDCFVPDQSNLIDWCVLFITTVMVVIMNVVIIICNVVSYRVVVTQKLRSGRGATEGADGRSFVESLVTSSVSLLLWLCIASMSIMAYLDMKSELRAINWYISLLVYCASFTAPFVRVLAHLV